MLLFFIVYDETSFDISMFSAFLHFLRNTGVKENEENVKKKLT